ncbi:hypothetical protein C0995_014538 [Termitomyces sp. Mi166|nr:hypothetical protein C0995_014538 [Termitomyces sp. Mi166\
MPSVPYMVVEEPFSPSIAMPSFQGQASQCVPVHSKGKGKVEVIEEDDDDKDEFDNKQSAALLLLPSEYYEVDVGLLQGMKISGGRKGDLKLVAPATWVLVLEKNGTCDHCVADNLAKKKHPSVEALLLAKHIKMMQMAKAFLEY